MRKDVRSEYLYSRAIYSAWSRCSILHSLDFVLKDGVWRLKTFLRFSLYRLLFSERLFKRQMYCRFSAFPIYMLTLRTHTHISEYLAGLRCWIYCLRCEKKKWKIDYLRFYGSSKMSGWFFLDQEAWSLSERGWTYKNKPVLWKYAGENSDGKWQRGWLQEMTTLCDFGTSKGSARDCVLSTKPDCIVSQFVVFCLYLLHRCVGVWDYWLFKVLLQKLLNKLKYVRSSHLGFSQVYEHGFTSSFQEVGSRYDTEAVRMFMFWIFPVM